MKAIDKAIYVFVVLVFLFGIYSIFYYFTVIKVQNAEYDKLLQNNEQLEDVIRTNNESLRSLSDSITIKDAEINYRDENIRELNKAILALNSKLDDNIHSLGDMPLNELLGYILDYYNTDTTEATIVTYENRIEVIIKPRLVREWSYTIAKLESAEIIIDTYKSQVNEYEYLTNEYESKICLLEARDSLLTNSLTLEQEKGINLKTLLDNRNKKIKSITLQRNLIGVGICAIIVIVLI